MPGAAPYAPGAGRALRRAWACAGRRADAEPLLLSFANDYNNDSITSTDPEGLAMVGRAMHLLRHPKDASSAFKDSVRADKDRLQTHQLQHGEEGADQRALTFRIVQQLAQADGFVFHQQATADEMFAVLKKAAMIIPLFRQKKEVMSLPMNHL